LVGNAIKLQRPKTAIEEREDLVIGGALEEQAPAQGSGEKLQRPLQHVRRKLSASQQKTQLVFALLHPTPERLLR
jgi:hypothetical protein